MEFAKEFADLSDESKDRLINTSLRLIRELTESYGAEKGMEMWNTIGKTIGSDVTGKLFFGMMTGEYSLNGVMLTKVNIGVSVPAIKSIRIATGLGLKDAKDIYDYVRDVGPRRIEVAGDARHNLLRELLYQGHSAH